MKKSILVVLLSLLVISCAAQKQKKVEAELGGQYHPINCATAEGDLRLLAHEKANVAQRIAEGVTSLTPAGIVIGIVT